MLCPKRKLRDGSPAEPKDTEINSIVNDAVKLKQIRSRLSDISWWMRLMCQKIAIRANREDEATGKFFKKQYPNLMCLNLVGNSLENEKDYSFLDPVLKRTANFLLVLSYTGADKFLDPKLADLHPGKLYFK